MSAAVEFAPHQLGRHNMLESMARPPHAYHEAFAPGQGYYPQEQLPQQPPQTPQQQQPRLPPMAAMISTAGQGIAYSGSRDAYTTKPGYYSEYATPSPVGQTPPQLPGPNSDPYAPSRRQMDARRSPTQSSTASDRSSDEVSQELRMRQISQLREQHAGQIPRQYAPPPRQRHDSFAYEGHQPMLLAKNPAASYPAAPNGRAVPPPQAVPAPLSPPTQYPHSSSASPRQEPKSMSISNLLSGDDSASNNPKRPMATPVRPPPYRINVRQQPFAARSCGFGERDRRVIDPPPIVELVIDDPSVSAEKRSELLNYKCLVVHCSIWDETGNKDMSTMPEDYRQQRRLMGTVVSSSFVGLDENGQEGCFFCFQDLSCRTPGTFRLRFAFVMIDPMAACIGAKSNILSVVMSEPFTVYNAKDFPGMQASTALTKRLKEQGCLISIKKGNEKGGSDKHGRDDSNDDDDEEEDSKPTKRRKRTKS